jgi:phage repressor protein C with HTH and peptisase S24 domain
MDNIDPSVAALKRLCAAQGGYQVVALEIGANGQTLYQILAGVKLPSGNPKGVGPALRKKLNAKYPGWLQGHVTEQQVPYQNLIREKDTVSAYNITSHPKTAADGNDVVIRQYDTGGSMGRGVLLKDQPGVIKEWCVSEEWLRLNVHRVTAARNLAIVTGFGDSMRGMFNPGDPLLVDRGVQRFDGDAVYFFRVDDEGFVKRLQSIPGEGLVVISENKAYRDWTIKAGMDFEVFGKVVKVWKGEDF